MNLPIFLLLGFDLVRGDECLYDIFVSQYGEVHSSMEKLAGKYTQTGTLNGMPYWTRNETNGDGTFQPERGVWYEEGKWIIDSLSKVGEYDGDNVNIKSAPTTATCPDSEDIEWYFYGASEVFVPTETEMTVKPYLIDSCPSELLVNLINTAKDIYPKVSGVYTKQSELSNDMPYWKNDNDQVLFFRRGYWKIGTLDQLGTKFENIQSLEAGLCPNSLSAKWMYLDANNDWQYEYDVELYSGCSPDITLAIVEDGADHLIEYYGEYTSTLDLDENGFPWWEDKHGHAIWIQANPPWIHWRIGSLVDRGTGNGVIKSYGGKKPKACPHSMETSEGQKYAEVTWQYKNTEGDYVLAEDHGMYTLAEACDSVCLEAKEEATKQLHGLVDTFNNDIDTKTADNEEDISTLESDLEKAGEVFETIVGTTEAWAEEMAEPESLKTKFDATVDEMKENGKLTDKEAESMKKSVEKAFADSPTIPPTKDEMVDKIKDQVGMEVAKAKKQNKDLKTTKERFKSYGSESIRKVRGMASADNLNKAATAAGGVASAIGKFQSADTMEIVSGILDITGAIAQFLPPPASILTESITGILGIFMPGASGPGIQDVIDAIADGFEEQKEFISRQFELQRQFIEDQFEKALEQIEDMFLKDQVEEIQRLSLAMLDFLQEKQTFLFTIDDQEALDPDELTRVTSELSLLDDTKDTSLIKTFFLTNCKGRAIRESRVLVESTIGEDTGYSGEVQICMNILYNYFTIERYRDELLVRFLALRNLEPNLSSVTESYWAVQKERRKDVQTFIQAIQADDPATSDDTHQNYSGLKIRCYICGATGEYHGMNVSNYYPDPSVQREMKDFVGYVKGQDDCADDPCQQAVDKFRATYRPEGVKSQVKTSLVTDGNWRECHRMNLNSMMTDATIDDAMKDSCFRDSVMVGCKRIDSTEFEVLAWSPRDIVLMEQDTAEASCGGNGRVTQETAEPACIKKNGITTIITNKNSAYYGKTYAEYYCSQSGNSFYNDLGCDWQACERGKASNNRGFGRPNTLPCDCMEKETCGSRTSNGVQWYRTGKTEGKDGSWGFAPEDAFLSLHKADVTRNNEDDKRMSFHVNDNTKFQGAHRCGRTKASLNTVCLAPCTCCGWKNSLAKIDEEGTGRYVGFDDNSEWELVVYHAN